MNHDGKLDVFEKAAEFATFAHMMDTVELEKETTDLELSGLDPDELEFMDEDY